MNLNHLILFMLLICSACQPKHNPTDEVFIHETFNYKPYAPKSTDRIISRSEYIDKLQGFWLGECIANWTGLVTEMDKIGNIGPIKTGTFYTSEDWGTKDQPSIWGEGIPSDLSETIDFVLKDTTEHWGSDDDTDIEYMYQHLLITHQTSILSSNQIADGWMKHIREEEENYLWVSNQKAFDLMQSGVLPPETSNPQLNEHFAMIDAQLSTEIFGLFAPTKPSIALEMAHLPIHTTAEDEAAWISEFYVIMHALAMVNEQSRSMHEQIRWMADQAYLHLPIESTAAKMYKFVDRCKNDGMTWEETRDAVYTRYQVNQEDGYTITSQALYCNGCFAAGINFASSLISLFYGEGDFKETIKIACLCGWDSDNPAATWGGLLGFMYGKQEIEKLFDIQLSNTFNIHRTRQNFPNDGIDNFENMAKTGTFIVDRVVQDLMLGGIDTINNRWYIPTE